MRKNHAQRLYRVVHTLEDGRRLYLSTRGKLMLMARTEADFWVEAARMAHSITIDELVYSKDLRLYGHRSYFLERLAPFVRVVATERESGDVAVDPAAFVIGGVRASDVDHQFRPRNDHSKRFVIFD
jgi:hypothetical protein